MRYFGLLSLVVIFLISSGCAGYRNAHLQETADGIKHSDTNISILEPSVYPTDMARAKEILSQAEINKAMAEQIKGGQTAQFAGRYTGIVVNQDIKRRFYFHHPDRNSVLQIDPGGYRAIRTGDIPRYIHGWFDGEDEAERYRIYDRKKKYNGIETDFGARVQY